MISPKPVPRSRMNMASTPSGVNLDVATSIMPINKVTKSVTYRRALARAITLFPAWRVQPTSQELTSKKAPLF